MQEIYTLSEIIKKRGVRKTVIAKSIGISLQTLRNKLTGETEFTWPEACKIQAEFFPDISKDALFKKVHAEQLTYPTTQST